MAFPAVTEPTVPKKSAGDLAFAFGSLPLSKRNSEKNKSSVAASAAEIDLREFSQTDRALLSHGTRILVCAGDVAIVG
jgi:hypothetical protein